MELQSALENRKSIRSYLSKDVEPEKLTALIEAASLAPSWKNSQTARYYVIHTPEKLEQIRATLPEFNRKNCEQAPALIITTVVLNRSGYERNGEPTNELGNGWGFYDCGLGSMALLLKATELGLSTLVMGIRDAAKVRLLRICHCAPFFEKLFRRNVPVSRAVCAPDVPDQHRCSRRK